MNKILQYSIFAFALLFASCKHEETTGPRLVNLFAEFTVAEPLTLSSATPDFSAGPLIIKAKFDKYVSWKLSITGKQTKATKVFTGSSPEMDIVWNGLSSNVPFFGLEACDVALSYPNFPERMPETATFTIKGVADPDKEGIIITDFKVSKVQDTYTGNFSDTTKWMSDFNATSTASLNPTPADGSPYLISSGTGGADPYVDQLNIYANASDKAYGKYWPLVNDPNRVYFNVMVYSSLLDTYKDASIQFIFNEEGGNTATAVVDPNWEGWQVKSFKYSGMKFKDATVPPRPDRVRFVSIVILTKFP